MNKISFNRIHETQIDCFQLSLFFDVMLAMCTGVSQESFLVGGTWGGSGDLQNSAVFRARSLIWDHLRSYEVHAHMLICEI